MQGQREGEGEREGEREGEGEDQGQATDLKSHILGSGTCLRGPRCLFPCMVLRTCYSYTK